MTTRIAVILAAGLGSRLGKHTDHQPKGFLQIYEDDFSLIERSIMTLQKQGIEHIYIGTGYLHQFYEDLASRFSNITCVYNENYAETGSLATLQTVFQALPENESILLLESDLLYEESGIRELRNHYKPNIILASDPTNSNDEVYIEATDKCELIQLSKDITALRTMYGELVGIIKLSYSLVQDMVHLIELDRKNQTLDYEDALVLLKNQHSIHIEKIANYTWCEIDTPEHWKFAREEVWPRIQLLENGIKRNVLLNPGPATTTTAVKLAQVQPDICPREVEFGQLMQDVSFGLTEIIADSKNYTTVLFPGSGTAAVEATLTSIIQPHEKVLIINNGAYGARMIEICEAFEIPFIEYAQDVTQPLNIDKIEVVLNEYKEITHVAVVHNETTTGILNDLNILGELCHQHQLTFIVDAMSSFAAIPINMKRQHIDYVMASSNKNIQGMAGVGFVICNREKIEQLENYKPKNFYLNLYAQYDYFNQTGQSRFTPPVQTLYALREAIREAQFETIEKRYERYSKSWETLIQGLQDLQLEVVIPLEHHSKIITAIYEPNHPNYSFNDLHDEMFDKGFTIYPGKVGSLNTFRIANIGAIDHHDISEFIRLLKDYFIKIER